jgi:hypothetical protein
MNDKAGKAKDNGSSADKAAVTLPGTVDKIIPPVHPSGAEKAQIAVEGADHLYREIRVENTLIDDAGKPVKLEEGAEVEVTIEADKKSTAPKSDR